MKYTQAIEKHKQELLVSKITGTNNWRVAKEFIWYIDFETKSTYCIIEEGFITNFGSIPRLLWFIFNPTKWLSYILHDKLYESKQVIVEGKIKKITRQEADIELFNCLGVEGMNIIGRLLVYIALRCFGWWAWNNS